MARIGPQTKTVKIMTKRHPPTERTLRTAPPRPLPLHASSRVLGTGKALHLLSEMLTRGWGGSRPARPTGSGTFITFCHPK